MRGYLILQYFPIRRLLKAGANVNAKDKHGRTVLHQLAMCNFILMLDEFAKRGVKLDAVDSVTESCLFFSSVHA
jgi:ankyrin repeat protein